MPYRPTYLQTDALDAADDLDFEEQLRQATAAIRFPSMLNDAISGIHETVKRAAAELPIIVSPESDAMQVRARQQAQASASAEAMPQESVAAPPETPEPAPDDAGVNGQPPTGAPSAGPSGPAPQAGGDLRAYARATAARYGLDPDIFERQINQESGFNPGAVSPAGAQGIAQFMPDTARGVGLADPFEPYSALDAAARHMADNLKRNGGDYARALAAYNAGQGAVDQYGGVPPFAETQQYIRTILGGRTAAPPNAGASPAPAASSPPPAAPAPSPPQAAAGGTITVRDAYGNVFDMDADAYRNRPGGTADLTVIRDNRLQPIPLDTGGGTLEPIPLDQGSGGPLTGPNDPRVQPMSWSPDSRAAAPVSAQMSAGRAGGGVQMSLSGQPADDPGQTGGWPLPVGAEPERDPRRFYPEQNIVPLADAMGNPQPSYPRPGTRNRAVAAGWGDLDEAPQSVSEEAYTPPEIWGQYPTNPGPGFEVKPLPGTAGPDDPQQYGWTSNIPDVPQQNEPGGPNQALLSYRLPLTATAGPDTTPDQPYDPDQGPHEVGYTVGGVGDGSVVGSTPTGGSASAPVAQLAEQPVTDTPSPVAGRIDTSGNGASTYNDPTADGTQAQPLPPAYQDAGPASDGTPVRMASGPPTPEETAQLQGTQVPEKPLVGPSPAEVQQAQAEAAPANDNETYLDLSVPSPPGWQALVDGAGNVVQWIRERTQGAVDQIGANMAGNRAAVEDANAGQSGGVDFGTGAQRVATNVIAPAAQRAAETAMTESQPPTDVQGAIERGVPSVRGLQIVQDTIAAFGDEAGRRVAAELGIPDEELATVFGIPITTHDVAGFVGSNVLDPTNYVGAGEAPRVARAIEEAAPGAVRAIGRGARALGEEAAYQATFGPRSMAQRVVQEGAGFVPEGGGPIRRSPPTVLGEPMPGPQRALPPPRGRSNDDLIAAAHGAVGVPEQTPVLDPGRLERWRRSFVRAWTDNRVDLAEAQKEAQQLLGRPLRGDEMMAELSRVNPSGAAKVAIDRDIRPILTGLDSETPVVTITPTRGAPIELTEVQVLSRLRELVNNRDIANVLGNPNRRFPGGLTGEESRRAALDLFSRLPEEAQTRIGQANRQVTDIVDAYRERLVDAGVWPRELADQLKEQYPNWVPTKILDYMRDEGQPGAATIRTIGLSNRHLHRYLFEGTDKMREDGIASLIRYVQQSEDDIAKNRTFNAFYNLREGIPEWQGLIREVKADTPVESMRGEKSVTGWVEGERRRFIVPAPLSAAIQMEQSPAVPVVATLSRAFRELVTRTPFFVAGQVPLDAASMIIREVSREGGPTPQNIARVTGALIGGYREAFRGLTDGTFHGDTARYLQSGGGMAGYYQRSAQAASTALDDVSRRSMLQIRNGADLTKTLKWLALQGPTVAVGERVELAPRTASYRLGLNRALRRGETDAAATTALVPDAQAGASGALPERSVSGVDSRRAELEAMTGARDVTLDFQRGGTWARVLNQFVPFSNVGIQSSVTPWRSFREKPAAYASTVVGLIGAPMVAVEAWNRSDPQRARDYDDVPDYVKDRGIVVMTGQSWTDKQGNRHPYYALWQTRELSPFVIFGRELAGRTMGALGVGKDIEPRTWGSLLEGALSAASPLQANSAADLFSSATPIGASTGLQLATNRDFFRNKDIATDRADQEAGVFAQGVAKATGARPSQVEFATRDMTGNVGAALLAGADLGASLMGTVPQGTSPKSLERTPVVGSVLSRFEGSAIGNRLQRQQERMLTPALKAAMQQAGLRDDQVTTVPNRHQNAYLRVDEQEKWQRAFNAEVPLALARARSSSEWALPGTRKQALQDALAEARDVAFRKALPGLTEGELQRRTVSEHQQGRR